MENSKDPFELYSSKIKSIFIPIIDDTKTDKIKNANDSFFIGRKPLIDKLKCSLCKDDSRNGAFLFLGKTSYVNKVLEEINSDALLSNKKMLDSILNNSSTLKILI